MIENKSLRSQAKDKDENVRFLSAPNLHTSTQNIEKQEDSSKHESSNNKIVSYSNMEIEEEEIIQQIDSSMEFEDDNNTEQRPLIKQEPKIATIHNKILNSRKNNYNENKNKSESTNNRLQDRIDDSAVDSSGITDVDEILEAHQDILQFVHILAHASEINFT